MSGGVNTLGQRSGSYGSLLQQVVTSQTSPVPVPVGGRKTMSKMMFMYGGGGGGREKERFLVKFFKVTGRRGFGMLLLVVVSVAVCLSVLSAICKDDVPDASTTMFSNNESESSDMFHRVILDVVNNTVNSVLQDEKEDSPIVKEQEKDSFDDQKKDNSTLLLSTIPVNDQNKSLILPPNVNAPAFPLGHPCEKFTLPPPPADKKRTGPRPCPVCYLPVEQAIKQMPSVPSTSPVLENLSYVYEENPFRTESFGGSDFGGYPSLQQRNESFDVKESMSVHCGFVKGRQPAHETGFDIDDADLLEMEQCHGIVVASAIFGNYDVLQHPKNISEAAKENVCFFMFVDEETEAYLKKSSALDDKNKAGLWKIVVIHNLPYADARRNGKVPKLLLHRLFPNVRFSLWIDGKLELVVDPYQILERFLWRNGATFAISRHYRRFDVFKEAEANKAAGKYDNASIDFQVDFYKSEGLTPYTRAKLPISSDVPEGCVIIREHIPITNLFTCLWFNEVDRFTSRDQLSFSTVRDKIMSRVNWGINMFLDCERRNFVVQAYHRDLLEHMSPPATPAAVHSPPALIKEIPENSSPDIITNKVEKIPSRKTPAKRRERRSKRHRKTAAGTRELNSIQIYDS